VIIRENERKEERVDNLRGGDGSVSKCDYLSESMPYHGKLFAKLSLEPGCSIGTHKHEGEYEVFFIIEGEATLNDNGVEKILYPGDVSLCREGEIHGIANRGQNTVKLFACIITEK